MKKVIWGTGLYAGEFAYAMQKEEIAFFIDNDKQKQGQYFMGKRIVTPDEIEDWNDLYIYVPFNFYDEIVDQLKGYGVNDNSCINKYCDSIKMSSEYFVENYENAITMLHKQSKQMKDSCVFWGRVWALKNRGYKEYIQAWKEKDVNLKLSLISEAVWYSQEETEDIMKLPAVVTPGIFSEDIYVEDLMIEEDYMHFLSQKKYGRYGVEYLQAKFPDLKEMDAAAMVFYMYKYVIQAIDILQPQQIITYFLFSIQHRILEEICNERGIPFISTHQGVLPGTLEFDISGEVGMSQPAIYPEKFLKLPVVEEELKYAQKVWDYLNVSRINRKIQPQNKSIDYVWEKIDRDKPIVFFAGAYDIGSDMVPYTEESRKYHSPIFTTSIEAGIYIAQLCEKNGWNFVYKPHPMYIEHENKSLLPSNTIYIEMGDINDLIDISDVIVTLVSSTSYTSLIRHKPVVMLGYTHIKGKECTYEAFEKYLIDDTIKEALNKGFTKSQKEAFLKHIAQLLKYYLYNDGIDREIRYGRKVPSGIEEFFELEKLLKEDAGKE